MKKPVKREDTGHTIRNWSGKKPVIGGVFLCGKTEGDKERSPPERFFRRIKSKMNFSSVWKEGAVFGVSRRTEGET